MADEGYDPKAAHGLRRFEAGNDAAVKHGAYADLALAEGLEEIADYVRECVPMYRPGDEFLVQTLALNWSRIKAGAAALATAKPGEMARLEQDMRGWINTERRLLNDLGLTPASRARMGVDVAIAQRARTLTSLHEDAARERARGDVVEVDAVEGEGEGEA